MSELAHLLDSIPLTARGLQLYRIAKGERLIACDPVIFQRGREAVRVVLLRATISGRVSIGGELDSNYFADVLDEDGDILDSLVLDARSYKALKYQWMRCKCTPEPTVSEPESGEQR